ncbi:hypothetical protein GDO81_018081 [Engystomops pustulosus]|uniref:Nucleolar protein 8 n=2 Tax=Engystomops pustulosus TaxID=76066 RepID=A0AAV7A9E3_ENGPU|nr:hypothetical protein GDO81_018081 [Engystomops pustulosus]
MRHVSRYCKIEISITFVYNMEATLKRLYVGGITPSVTDSELTERFGRFGKVDQVEIISRKDDQGNIIKTFAYMNINISDTDLKKCFSMLNKTKWKGGVLQIEMAKESFLHKLEKERQVAKEKKAARQESHPQSDLMQSLEKAGVTDFQMKAAVPGTEVPNHKNWVVSKYGRVLPVLHIKGSNESKIIKYDPSKYCHNIKKLDNLPLEETPVSQLTWHLDGGDDDISKKRRGEFPEFKIPPKKSKVNSYLNTCWTDENGKGSSTPQTTPQKLKIASPFKHNRDTFESNHSYRGRKSINSMSDDEYDSEEELHSIIEREKMGKGSGRHAEDSDVEIVDDSLTLGYKNPFTEEIGKSRQPNGGAKDDNEYDSADTDEIITTAKTTPNYKNDRKKTSNSLAKQSGISKDKSISTVKQEDPEDSKEEESESNDSEKEESSDSYSDEEYESMMQNCYRLDLSIGDLEALAKDAAESDGDSTDENNDSSQEYDSSEDTNIVKAGCLEHETAKKQQKSKFAQDGDLKPDDHSNDHSAESSLSHSEGECESPKKNSCPRDNQKAMKKRREESTAVIGNLKRKKGIEPEDIVASILESDEDSSSEQPKRKKKNASPCPPPQFKGLGSLMSSLAASSVSSCGRPSTNNEKKASSTSFESNVIKVSKDIDEGSSKPVKATSNSVHQRSGKKSSSDSSTSSTAESSSDDELSPASLKVPQRSSVKEQNNSKAKQLQDNQKRLAAMEERRKEREKQKQAIQGALLKLDTKPENKTQHIVFNSESEEESKKEEEASTSNLHGDSIAKPEKAKLFDSSGEDSDDEEEKDDDRFEIKTQYEGRSGEKLMQLQSRFGTDERFKMDARFLEDSSGDEEDTEQTQSLNADGDDKGLSDEKKKNLEILQSVLNINVAPQSTSKKAAQAKKFKDLNALQYDPTKDDHAAFETKVEEEKKESKSERRKKRLEAEKLPEVSKKIFHEVTIDFKEVFGAPKPQVLAEPEKPWDQVEEPQQMEVEENSISNVDHSLPKMEDSAGFTFSFFGTSTEEQFSQDEQYKVENIKAAKVAWQEDPRFQDSSSEEEEAEKEDTAVTVNASPQMEKSSGIRFFFFVKNDERLKEGPKMFCRSSKSEQNAKDWEDLRSDLMDECKKRHKDAKKKLRASH